jgi:RNA polymerase sigma factor (sigma-70 family)
MNANTFPLIGHLRRFAGGPCTSVPDSQLLERFVGEGDQAAFELLVWRHERMVLDVCRRILHSQQDAEDVSQATFLALACKAGSIGKREAVASWLYKVAFRAALRERTCQHARTRREKEGGLARAVAAESVDAQSNADDADVRQVVHEEVHRLPEKYRSPVVLCYLEGRTNEEAARQLSCPTGTVVTRLARARQRLRNRLEKRGLALSAAGMTVLLSSEAPATASTATIRDLVVRSAPVFVSDRTAAGLISARVAALSRGILHTMLMSKLKNAAVILLSLGLLGAGSGLLAYGNLAHQRPARAPEPTAVALANPEPPAAPATPNTAKDADADSPSKKKTVSNEQGNHTVNEKVSKTFKTGKSPKVVVEMYNGAIEVVADSDSGVQADVTKHGRAPTEETARHALEKVEVKMTQDGDTVRVVSKRTDEEHIPNTSSGASAVLKVPAGSALELHTRNGHVSVAGGSGKVAIDTANGRIEAKKSKGALNLHTSNGEITVTGGTGRLELKTSNGAVRVNADQAVVSAETRNGAVEFHGTLAAGEHKFHTSNGGIALYLPGEGVSFRVNAATSLGSIQSDFQPDQVTRKNRSHLEAVVGSNPSVSIDLRTSNGGISIHRSKEK